MGEEVTLGQMVIGKMIKLLGFSIAMFFINLFMDITTEHMTVILLLLIYIDPGKEEG